MKRMVEKKSNKTKLYKRLVSEKSTVISKCNSLSLKHGHLKNIIGTLYEEVNRKTMLLRDSKVEVAQRSMLTYDLKLSQEELEKTIQEKEILNKDIHILQARITYLEKELKNAKPWWQRIF